MVCSSLLLVVFKKAPFYNTGYTTSLLSPYTRNEYNSLEEYRLDAVLGAGGFGITYRAHDANLDKFVAVKEYLPGEFATRTERNTVVPQSSKDAQDYHWGLNRFLDEARTLARFDHPHLNRVHRFFKANGTAYMVLEYIEGETLANRLARERQLSEELLQRLLAEVLSGLAVMHAAGYVHRDIKPGNLMLREQDGSAVVLDFGAARQAVGQRSKALTSILTPGYAPIEQYDSQADDVGPWSDIYALGMVAYRCISGLGDGELPDAVTRGRARRKGQTGLTPAVESGKGRYNSGLLEAIDWALEVDEEARPQSVDAWRAALAEDGRRQHPAESKQGAVSNPPSGTATEHTGMNWSERSNPGSVEQTPLPAPGDTLQRTSAKPAIESAGSAAGQAGTAPAEAASAQEDEVTRLLAGAEADLKARRLTNPARNNAWDRYQRVLEIDPTNPDAAQGMDRVIDICMELFGIAVEQEDFEQADSYLDRIGELHPDSPVLMTGRQQLAAARQAELERQRIANVIEEHWAAFDAALQARKLHWATDILAQVRDLNPETPGFKEREQRLASMGRQASVSCAVVVGLGLFLVGVAVVQCSSG